MSIPHKALLAFIGSIAILASLASITHAEPLANKFVFSSTLGFDVNKTALQTPGSTQADKNLCTAASKDECQVLGQESGQTGAFNFPVSVAVDNDPASPQHGDVYVADEENRRVQVFTAEGAFVSMFGIDVNKTAVEAAGSTQAEKNICTAASEDECQAGVKGEAPGQFSSPLSVAVDPDSGNVYVAEAVYEEGPYGYRVQAFTGTGEWLYEIGQEVNGTTKANLCTRQEAETGAKCKGPQPTSGSASTGEHGAFKLGGSTGNIVAVGGPEDLLYVGDEHRVQEFTAGGEWHGEISLSSLSAEAEQYVLALAVNEAGEVYLTYGPVGRGSGTTIVHEYAPNGAQTAELEVTPAEPNPERVGFMIRTLTFDPHGRLAVTTQEELENEAHQTFRFSHAFLYSAEGVRISEITPPSGSLPGSPNGLAFSRADVLYVATGSAQEIEVFAPVLAPEARTCDPTNVAATSALLCGGINANALATRGFFEFGPPTGSQTPTVFEGEGTAFEPASWELSGLTPNETYDYQMVAEAQINGERVTDSGEPVSFHTPTPAAEVPGTPLAANVGATSALLSAEVDPEHALTRYHFEYGRCPTLTGCAEVLGTATLESGVYGSIGVDQDASGLQPGSVYSFRLVADNEHEEAGGVMQGGSAVGAEGHFTTAGLPAPVAESGVASGVGVSTATVSGLVDSGGEPAVYAFELGVYRGGETQYGIVLSAPAPVSEALVPVSVALSGLQAGTAYAFRVTVRNGYSESIGATSTFTTEGLPAVLPVTPAPTLLAVPNISFPAAGGVKPAKKAKHGKTSKCVKHGARRCAKRKSKKLSVRRGALKHAEKR